MASSSSSSSSSTRVRNYDVFLSFRGIDTRNNIVSHLYEALRSKGIITFRDDRSLEAGDKISDKLMEAINTSRFAVVVISENYATSKWCLEELRLIMDLRGNNQIQVVPIFYGVEPSDVRNQTGSFAAAFQKYEDLDTTPAERVYQWRRALNGVSHLSGFHSRTSVDEAAMISNTVRSVSSQLLKMRPTSGNDLVGMEAHMMKMHLLLNMGSESEVLIIGIWGMGGVGKTTTAKYFYDRFSRLFPARYFIEDIRNIYKDKSPSYLQEQFLCSILSGQHIGFQSDEARSQELRARLGHQKVFLVLDGVDKAEQIHALAKETSWFDPGSRIIITTRDKGLLNSCGVNNVHEVKCLDDKDALRVFERIAYGGQSPPSNGIEQLFTRASRLAHGLPSALVSYALYLSENKTVKEWEDELDLLETRPHKNVEKILRNSYDDLDEQDKITFLHVACLLNRYPFNHATSLIDDGRPRMNHLTAKSLISISTDGCINMHFLVEQTGKAIVRQESRNRPSRQRCLWDAREIYDVLDDNRGTDEIEGLSLHTCEMDDNLALSSRAFDIMPSIKFIKFFQHFSDAKFNVQLRLDGLLFPRTLRLLHWDMYPFEDLPSRFRHHYLVELNLQYSNLIRLWDKTVNLPSLRRLDVTGSKNLRELPDSSTAEGLEELIVEGCMRLERILESLRNYNKLTKLNTIHCDILRRVMFIVKLSTISTRGDIWQTVIVTPDKGVQIHFLTDISIEGQIYIDSLDFSGQIEYLSFGSKKHLPDQSMAMELHEPASSSCKPCWLEIIQFRYTKDRDPFHCSSFKSFAWLTELKLINLNIQDIPDDIMDLTLLEKLDLDGNDFVHLPETMCQLRKLKYLSLGNCRKLKAVPQLCQVETLILSDCVNLESLLPTYCSLELWLDNCKNVKSLSETLSHFKLLTYLDLSRNNFVRVPSSIREFSFLKTLFLNNCMRLKSVEELPQSVKHLYAHGCDSLESVTLSPNHSIKHLDLIHCAGMNLEEHEHLRTLHISKGHSQQGSQKCACFPKTGVYGYSDYRASGTSLKINRTGKLVDPSNWSITESEIRKLILGSIPPHKIESISDKFSDYL